MGQVEAKMTERETGDAVQCEGGCEMNTRNDHGYVFPGDLWACQG